MKAKNPVSPSLALLILMTPLGSALYPALVPALPLMSAHYANYPYADMLVRGLVTVMGLAMVIGSPIAGLLVERFGMRKVMLSAAFIFTISGLGCFFVEDLRLLFALRFVAGLAEVMASTSLLALIADRLQADQRNRWIGVTVFSGSIGSLLWIELAGLVTHYNWRFIFLFYGIGIVIFATAFIAVRRTQTAAVPVPRRFPLPRMSLSTLRPLLPLMSLALMMGMTDLTPILFVPFHLTEIGETSPARIAQAILPLPLGMGIAGLLYGYVRRWLSIRATFIFAFVSSGISLLIMGSAQSYAMVLVGVTAFGLCGGLLSPNLYAYAATYGTEEHQARNIGLARGLFFLGPPLAQLLMEPVSRYAGSGMALVTLGVASLVLAALVLPRRGGWAVPPTEKASSL